MLLEERFESILHLLADRGSVTVQGLSRELGISESTARRDLNELDRQGKLTKVFGGAVVKRDHYLVQDDDVLLRKSRMVADKTIIAKYAASLIQDDDFVYIDAGTTTELLIDYLEVKQAIFVTNGITHAQKLAAAGRKVYLLGGELKGTTEAVVGPEAVESLQWYNFTIGFWGANGVSIREGFTTPEVSEGILKKKSMEHTKQCYVLADASKFGQISSMSFSAIDDAIVLTTKLQDTLYKQRDNIVEVNV